MRPYTSKKVSASSGDLPLLRYAWEVFLELPVWKHKPSITGIHLAYDRTERNAILLLGVVILAILEEDVCGIALPLGDGFSLNRGDFDGGIVVHMVHSF